MRKIHVRGVVGRRLAQHQAHTRTQCLTFSEGRSKLPPVKIMKKAGGSGKGVHKSNYVNVTSDFKRAILDIRHSAYLAR